MIASPFSPELVDRDNPAAVTERAERRNMPATGTYSLPNLARVL